MKTQHHEFDQLNPKAQANALWEIAQRNQVASHQEGRRPPVLTVDNSLFYSNGVYAGRR